ncbi:hypothetical protein T4E_7877 [Trichinella pseudospiralis]|uniref:Uncharacterized protein n=1 Tax=Trichinella pseudospiralis TaxID=6337 RepID=A0A0V0XZL4_TRIPS|nr:hypothetical protein T4E_7877 [Trichinella pseudospiralis]
MLFKTDGSNNFHLHYPVECGALLLLFMTMMMLLDDHFYSKTILSRLCFVGTDLTDQTSCFDRKLCALIGAVKPANFCSTGTGGWINDPKLAWQVA